MASQNHTAAPSYMERVTVTTGIKRIIGWHGIAAGVVASLILQVLLSMLGIAIGLSVAEDRPSQIFQTDAGYAAALWWAASGVLSAFLGGLIAGMFSAPRRTAGIACGLLAWAIGVLLVLATMGSVAGLTFDDAMRTFAAPRNASPETMPLSPEDLSSLALYGLIALILGAVAAAIGGALGVKRTTED